ncbi:hypothetical protein ACRALDRAFT_2041507 [Sodiomyces alcalophilus JCM 7366]|uniref:uncharacterized protein n=1 Tax=Sodiomyces alcalophilus JCM 7366 TaxID=591952 RepID=UPI0039B54A39
MNGGRENGTLDRTMSHVCKTCCHGQYYPQTTSTVEKYPPRRHFSTRYCETGQNEKKETKAKTRAVFELPVAGAYGYQRPLHVDVVSLPLTHEAFICWPQKVVRKQMPRVRLPFALRQSSAYPRESLSRFTKYHHRASVWKTRKQGLDGRTEATPLHLCQALGISATGRNPFLFRSALFTDNGRHLDAGATDHAPANEWIEE